MHTRTFPSATRFEAATHAIATSLGPNAAQTRFLTGEGGRLAYDDSGGAGPLVVAVPGMGDLRSQYRAIRPALVALGYRVVTLDVRGFGESSAQWPDLSARAVGLDVLRIIDHLGHGPAVVLGNSFAAGSALWAAADAPAKVRGVVLIGPVVRDGPPRPVMQALLRLAFAGPWRVAFWLAWWSSLFTLRRPDDHAQAKAALRRNLKEPGRMAALRTMVHLSKSDTESMLVSSRVPALVVMGERDPDFPDAAAEARWLAHCLHADLMLIDGAGHYPHLECADAVARRVVAFMQDLHRPGR